MRELPYDIEAAIKKLYHRDAHFALFTEYEGEGGRWHKRSIIRGFIQTKARLDDIIKHSRKGEVLAIKPSSLGCFVVDIDDADESGVKVILSRLGSPLTLYKTHRGYHLWYKWDGVGAGSKKDWEIGDYHGEIHCTKTCIVVRDIVLLSEVDFDDENHKALGFNNSTLPAPKIKDKSKTGRNDTLNRRVYEQAIKGDQEGVIQAVKDAFLSGLEIDEVESTLQSSLKAAADTAGDNEITETFPRSGRGIRQDAKRLIQYPPTTFLSTIDSGGKSELLIGDQRGMWNRNEAKVLAWCKEYGDYQLKLFSDYEDEDYKPKENDWGEYNAKWGSPKHTKNMIETIPGILQYYGNKWAAKHGCETCFTSDLDSNLEAIGSPSGVRLLNDPFTVLPPQKAREMFITKSLPVDPDEPFGNHPLIETLLGHFPEDVLIYLKAALGWAMHGIPSRRFYLIMGQGNEGKSTLLQLIQATLGEYAVSFSKHAIEKASFSGERSSPELESFMSSRIACCSDTMEANDKLDFGRIKALSGGDTISWRKQYHNYSPGVATATMFIVVNKIPKLGLSDPAIEDRIHILPYPRLPGDADKTLITKVKNDLHLHSAFLSVILQSASVIKEPPLAIEVVEETIKQQRDEELGEVGDALRACVKKTGVGWLTSKELFAHVIDFVGEDKGGKGTVGGYKQRGLVSLAVEILDLPKPAKLPRGTGKGQPRGWMGIEWKE